MKDERKRMGTCENGACKEPVYADEPFFHLQSGVIHIRCTAGGGK